MDKLEADLLEKEVEITRMKGLLQETKDELSERSKEVDVLKLKTGELEKEICLLKESKEKVQRKDQLLSKVGHKYSSTGEMNPHSRFIESNFLGGSTMESYECAKDEESRRMVSLMTTVLLKCLENDVRELKDRFD